MLIDGKLFLDNVTDDYEITHDSDYKYLFTLKSTNNSLKFRFGSNCTLIFHTNLEPISGDFVIAYLPDKELFVYRDLEIKDGKKILNPADQDIYKKIILKKTDFLVAVLYEKRIKRPFV
jgi:SOS-response transcriptional repressor LexA